MDNLAASWLPLAIGFGAGVLLCVIVYVAVIRALDTRRSAASLKMMKDQFIALCSHYLLSPITIIQTAIVSLQEDALTVTPAQRDKMYDNIFRGQQRLWILAEQFLLVQQIEGNDVKLNIAVSNVSEMVTQAVTAIDPFAREKGVMIHIVDDAGEVRECRMDIRRMKLALVAILDNAVKFSPQGGQIGMKVTLVDNLFSIEISDQGPGMSKEVLSHLSEGFYRGSSIYTFDFEGMGLGTYVATSMMRLHGGSIAFNSKEKQGSSVLIQFPAE